MNHVRAITITGQEVEITHEEAQRIAKMLNPHPHSLDAFHVHVKERNEHYLRKADNNIREIAERHGIYDLTGSEDELKALLSTMLHTSEAVGDLIVEIAEQRIATHHKEIYSE